MTVGATRHAVDTGELRPEGAALGKKSRGRSMLAVGAGRLEEVTGDGVGCSFPSGRRGTHLAKVATGAYKATDWRSSRTRIRRQGWSAGAREERRGVAPKETRRLASKRGASEWSSVRRNASSWCC